MKVKDVIAELQKHDPEATCVYEYDGRDIEVFRIDGTCSEEHNSYPVDSPMRSQIKNLVVIW